MKNSKRVDEVEKSQADVTPNLRTRCLKRTKIKNNGDDTAKFILIMENESILFCV